MMKNNSNNKMNLLPLQSTTTTTQTTLPLFLLLLVALKKKMMMNNNMTIVAVDNGKKKTTPRHIRCQIIITITMFLQIILPITTIVVLAPEMIPSPRLVLVVNKRKKLFKIASFVFHYAMRHLKIVILSTIIIITTVVPVTTTVLGTTMLLPRTCNNKAVDNAMKKTAPRILRITVFNKTVKIIKLIIAFLFQDKM